MRRSLKVFLTILSVWLCAGSQAQQLGFYIEKRSKHVSIPIEIHNNLVILPVELNGRFQLNFILDTGVRPTILLDRSLTDSLGITYTRTVGLLGFGNDTEISALVTEPLKIELDGVKNTGMPMLVLEQYDPGLATHLGIHIHGIIGYEFFSRFVVKIDYDRKRVVAFEREAFRIGKRYDVIDLQVEEGKPHFQAHLRVQGTMIPDAKLLVDTGASHALIVDNRALGIEVPIPNIASSLGRSIAGEIDGYLARIERLDIGNQRLHDVIVSFPETVREDTGDRRVGSVGGELLRKFTVIFDFLSERMYLRKNSNFKYPFEYNMSGLEFVAIGEDLDQFVISSIRADAAAANVGFRRGDVVVSLNNVPSDKLDLSKIYTSLNEKAGKQINLTVYRDGQYISRTFQLKREI